jgi:hypothetical protein
MFEATQSRSFEKSKRGSIRLSCFAVLVKQTGPRNRRKTDVVTKEHACPKPVLPARHYEKAHACLHAMSDMLSRQRPPYPHR